MTVLIVIVALALIFDYINGFHDAANSIATVVSTKVLTPLQAVLWAAFFNFVAFFVFKDHGVANTIANTVKEGTNAAGVPYVTNLVIVSALVAAIAWNLLTWWFGIPSSSSHTLIGGLAGAAIAHGGFESIQSSTILTIGAFIILAPLIGGIMGLVISLWFMNSFRKSVLPKFVSLCVIVLALVLLSKETKTSPSEISGLKKLEPTSQGVQVAAISNKTPATQMGFRKGDIIESLNGTPVKTQKDVDNIFKKLSYDAPLQAIVKRKTETDEIDTPYITEFKSKFVNTIMYKDNFKWLLIAFILISTSIFTLFLSGFNYSKSEKWFKRMQLLSSAAFSVGHGGNDAQKVMGIITVALIVNHEIADFEQMPVWVPLACYAAIGIGTMSGGWKIIKTMGTKITKVTPFEGVAAETAGALTLFLTEMLKIPVSTTHTITGAIIGVGASKRVSAVRWGVTVSLVWAWLITIPVSAMFAAVVYWILNIFFPQN